MTSETKNDKSTMMELLCSWLIGAGFSGFKFDTAFTLSFIRDKAASFRGLDLPWVIELHLLGNWWFGPHRDWMEKVSEIGQGIEPDEPVKASELALLRWSDGAVIKDIELSEDTLILTFANQTALTVSLEAEDDYVFSIKEAGVNEEDAYWSATCDGENYYYRVPSN